MQTVRLYRAVSLEEALDIERFVGFRGAAGTLEGKWFAESRTDALAWGRLLFGANPFRVVSATVPALAAEQLFRLQRLDNIGPARFVAAEALGQLELDQVYDE
jgi:hypothetical protein